MRYPHRRGQVCTATVLFVGLPAAAQGAGHLQGAQGHPPGGLALLLAEGAKRFHRVL